MGKTRKTRWIYKLASKNLFDSIFMSEDNPIQFGTDIDNIISEANLHHKDNWDFVILPSNSGTVKFELYLAIKYNEVEIINSKGESHIIRDLFLFLRIKKRRIEDHLYIDNVLGSRMTLTNLEEELGYLHSHLRTNRNFISANYWKIPGEFCFGGAEINSTLDSLYVSFNREMFSLLLVLLDGFVAWESLEGVPYINLNAVNKERQSKISRLKGLKAYVPRHTPDSIDFLINELVPPMNEEGLPIEIKNSQVYLDSEKFQIKLNRYAREFLSEFNKKTFLTKFIEGRYYSYSGEISQNIAQILEVNNHKEDVGFYFRGELTSPKLIVDPEITATDFSEHMENIEEYSIHPDIAEELQRKVENMIFYYLISKTE